MAIDSLSEEARNFFAIIAAPITLGILLDHLFGLRNITLEVQDDELQDQTAVWKYISTIYKKVFTDRFGTKALSVRYFLNSVLFSMISIVIVGIIQYLVHPQIVTDYFSSSRLHIVFLSFLFLANLFIDWISVYQTNNFLRYAVRERSKSKLFLMMFSDYIITLNGFILLYSLSVFTLLALIVVPIQNEAISNIDQKINFVIQKSKAHPDSQFLYHYTVDAEMTPAREGRGRPFWGEFQTNLTMFDPTNIRVFHGANGVKRFSIDGDDLESYDQAHEIINGSSEIQYEIELEYGPTYVEIDSGTYLSIFTIADRTEVAYVAYLGVRNFSYPTWQFLGLRFRYAPAATSILCYEPSNSIISIMYEEEEHACEDAILWSAGLLVGPDSIRYNWDIPMMYDEIPLGILLASSLVTTFIIYFAIIALPIVLSIKGIFQASQSSIYYKFISRSPFGMVGLLMGIVIYIF